MQPHFTRCNTLSKTWPQRVVGRGEERSFRSPTRQDVHVRIPRLLVSTQTTQALRAESLRSINQEAKRLVLASSEKRLSQLVEIYCKSTAEPGKAGEAFVSSTRSWAENLIIKTIMRMHLTKRNGIIYFSATANHACAPFTPRPRVGIWNSNWSFFATIVDRPMHLVSVLAAH